MKYSVEPLIAVKLIALTALLGFVPAQGLAASDEVVKAETDLDLSQLLNLGRMVVSATKTAMRIEDAPSVIDTITAQEIEARGYETVGEALRSISGLATIDDHLNYNVGVRGIYASPDASTEVMKLMINGQSVAFRPTSSNLLGYELIPIAAVARIEVIRGPASALYGANAFLGVVNVITKDAKDLAFNNTMQLVSVSGGPVLNPEAMGHGASTSLTSLGDFGDVQLLLALGAHHGDRSGLMLPGREDIQLAIDGAPANNYPSPGPTIDTRKKKYIIDDDGNPNAMSKGDLERTGSGYAQLSWNTGMGEVTLDAHLQYFDKFGEFQDYSVLTHQNRMAFYNSYLRLSFVSPDFSGLRVRTSVTRSSGEPLGQESFKPLKTSNRLERQVAYEAYDLLVELTYLRGDHTFTAGMDYTHDAEDFTQMVPVNTSGSALSSVNYGEADFNNLGVLAQWLWTPLSGLGLTLGVRGDNNSMIGCNANEWDCIGSREDEEVAGDPNVSSDDITITNQGNWQISSRAALVVGLPLWDAYVKVLYGASFKPPSPFQLYHQKWASVGTTTGNPGLKPQTADTFEAMLGLMPMANLRLTSNLFLTSVHDMVVAFKEGDSLIPRNANVSSLGLELALTYRVSSVLEAYANTSLLLSSSVSPQPKDAIEELGWSSSSFNKSIPVGMYPNLLVNAGVNYELLDGVALDLAVHFVGERDASYVNNSFYLNNIAETYSFDPYFLTNATLKWVVDWLDYRDTTLGLSLRGVPMAFQEPGQGGVDIPAMGSSLTFSLSQEL